MSTEPEKKTPLALLAGAYEPTDAEIERQLSKIQATLAKPTSAVRPGNKAFLFGLSCASIALVGAVALILTRGDSSTAGHPIESLPPALAPATTTASQNRESASESAPQVPSAHVDALPSVVATTAKKPSPPPSAPSSPDDTLEREARLLAEAVRMNRHGDGERALELLEEHARLFPNGWLVSERAAERIMVLCSLGRRDQAKREARVFLGGRPKSPLAHRVETSCAGQSSEE
ncbi:hypothetical protein AKJ09_05778 [Labilithrix luteola]|uniref:Tetratricopeptide repeat protein n=1 Tax=Labilithrix luteola TaxID=1391654 RepID=A0A0K1Q124_9BACT|nr:hypothetical protein [Labilithrix luteola]AKU99114.1 hypothetical protein AKJ09_05778 [Labilithrix luteola]